MYGYPIRDQRSPKPRGLDYTSTCLVQNGGDRDCLFRRDPWYYAKQCPLFGNVQQGATGEVLVTKAKHKLQYMYYKTSPTPKQGLPNVHLDEGRLYRWTPLGAIRNPRTGKLRQKHGKTITQDEIQRNITSEEPRPLSPKSRASKRQFRACITATNTEYITAITRGGRYGGD